MTSLLSAWLKLVKSLLGWLPINRMTKGSLIRSQVWVSLLSRRIITHIYPVCRRNYIRTHHKLKESSGEENEHIDTNENAFEFISQYVETNIINGFVAERLTMLRERYCIFMQSNHPNNIILNTRLRSWTQDWNENLVVVWNSGNRDSEER